MAGSLSEDRTRWTSAQLDYDVRYTGRATGMGAAGRPVTPLETAFRTVRPNRTLGIDAFRPSDGAFSTGCRSATGRHRRLRHPAGREGRRHR